MKLKTVLKYGVIILILGSAAYGGYRYFNKQKVNVKQNFYTEKITVGDVTDSISATGTVEPEELINVGAQVQGQKKAGDHSGEIAYGLLAAGAGIENSLGGDGGDDREPYERLSYRDRAEYAF